MKKFRVIFLLVFVHLSVIPVATMAQLEERNIDTDYTRISLSQNISMIVDARTDGVATIKAPKDIASKVILQVINGTLRAGLNSKNSKYDIEIHVPNSGNISSVELNGQSALSIIPLIKVKNFDVDLRGVSKMQANVHASNCKADISGATSLELSFEGDNIFLDASGASKANLELMCVKSSFDLSGASKVTAVGVCESVESESSGASKLITANLSRGSNRVNRNEYLHSVEDNTYLASNSGNTYNNPNVSAQTLEPNNIQQNAASASHTTVQGLQAPIQQTPTISNPASDVDVNIPTTNNDNNNTFVLIIANENYAFVDDVQFALNDGEIFREYCIKTLGVPERQVWLYKNASMGIIAGGVDKMVQAMNIFDGARAIVYYCGHGIPDEKTGDAYIIPVDGRGTNTATCYSLNQLYKTMASAKTSNVTYFMDACFTGANRDGSMLVAARGVAREAKKEVITGNTVVFSAASGDETAMPFKEKGHGLFTYFLLKKLQETKGDVTYGELAEYINNNVKKEAFLTNEKPQNPVVATSESIVSTWKNEKIK